MEINSIEFEDDIVEIPLSPGGEHSFEIAVINYGSPTNVYFSTSDNLKDHITFLEDNPYVRHEEYVPVISHLPIGGEGFVEGEIYVTVGYGSRTSGFSIKIGSEKSANISVEVDVDDHIAVDNIFEMNRNSNKGDSGSTAYSIKSILDVSPRLALLIAGVLIASFMIYVLSTQATGIEFEMGFYLAVILAILFTALIMYLFLKLPINK